MRLPVLPPAYTLVALDRDVPAFERAIAAAPRGLEDGTVYWTDRADRLELGIALEPEAPPEATLLAVYVLTVAVGDALTGLRSPVERVAFAWPGHLLASDQELGRVRARLAPAAPETAPPWLVLGLSLAWAPRGGVAELVEGVGHHFLRWTGRRLAAGLDPVRAAWNRRCYRRGEDGALRLDGRAIAGRIEGLDEAGAFVIGGQRLALSDALASLA